MRVDNFFPFFSASLASCVPARAGPWPQGRRPACAPLGTHVPCRLGWLCWRGQGIDHGSVDHDGETETSRLGLVNGFVGVPSWAGCDCALRLLPATQTVTRNSLDIGKVLVRSFVRTRAWSRIFFVFFLRHESCHAGTFIRRKPRPVPEASLSAAIDRPV